MKDESDTVFDFQAIDGSVARCCSDDRMCIPDRGCRGEGNRHTPNRYGRADCHTLANPTAGYTLTDSADRYAYANSTDSYTLDADAY
ncbi:MAG TPA: hypothetical protein PKZ84_06900 [Anaerolineae bacterium]|nr:hypothetical protein [Anaerolineae bacterium]HQI84200.1 hypothetical protein [Anaerolineae bacterium]